jgi:melibiose permease/lactose/raffinose/galactose permease
MWIGQLITVIGVKEPHIVKTQKTTPLRELLGVIIKNDQLLFTAISMTLFMIGYMTTTTFGLYFFKYAYGNEDMFSIFALILGISQITALAIFPVFSKKWNRKTLFNLAIILVTLGYIIFFFAPTDTMVFIGIAGVLLFVGQAFIQLMMLMFLADSVDYGHLKLGKRNDSITFSLQPFINKMSGAIGNGVVGFVIIITGIVDAVDHTDVTEEGLLIMKIAMLIFPLICIGVSYLVYRWKYIIDETKYAEILSELKAKGVLEV